MTRHQVTTEAERVTGSGKATRARASRPRPSEAEGAGDPEGAADDPDVEYLGPVAMVLPPERR